MLVTDCWLSSVSSLNSLLPGKDAFTTHTNLSPQQNLLDICLREMLLRKDTTEERLDEQQMTPPASAHLEEHGKQLAASSSDNGQPRAAWLKSEMTTS